MNCKNNLRKKNTQDDTDSDDIVLLDEDKDTKVAKVVKTKKREIGKPSTSSLVQLNSDSDKSDEEDFYSNILQRKQKKVLKKKTLSPTKRTDDLDSTFDDFNTSNFDYGAEDELSLEERIKLQIEKQEQKEKATLEKENELIRGKALSNFVESTDSTREYVNPMIEETMKELRAIRAMENQTGGSPDIKQKKRRRMDTTQEPTIEGIANIVVRDLEVPCMQHPIYPVKMTESFDVLRDVIAEKWNVVSACVRIEMADDLRLINDGDTPTSLGIQPHEYVTVTAMVLGDKITKKDPLEMELKIQIEGGHRSKSIQVKKNMLFADIKLLIIDAWKLQGIRKLVFDAEEISDFDTPESLDIDDGTVIDVYQ